MLPWSEKLVSFQINPESATIQDIVRMAEELVEIREALDDLQSTLRAVCDHIDEWKRQK